MQGILGDCKLNHVCIVTRDLEKTKNNYARLTGMAAPETIVNEDYANMHTWFKDLDASRSGLEQCTFAAEGGNVELIMPNTGPSAWNEYLDAHGEGLHHLCFEVKELDAVVARCEENGMKKIQTGDFPGGHYAYVDATGFVGTYLELLEFLPE